MSVTQGQNGLVIHSFPLKLGGTGVLVDKILTKKGVMKKLLRNSWSNLKGAGFFYKVGFPNCFVSFPSEKHVSSTIGIPFFLFLSGKYSRCNQ